jgi:uncharacterized protein (DUF2235 family)
MGKNIVICCDGTGNKPGEHNSNVVKIFEMIEKDFNTQMAFYDPGIATAGPKFYASLTGYGLSQNIKEAYLYLMSNYREDDKVYLFGFSRGAYTVRCLAGILKKIGLLPKGNFNLVDYAIEQYFELTDETLIKNFKSTFARECNIHLIGVWDTVAAFIPFPPSHKFKNNTLNTSIPFGYQALAIDEKRKNFKPELWDKNPSILNQTIEQVWFAGVHSDIGGSYPESELSDISLRWMMEKAVAQGLLVEADYYKKLNPKSDGKIHESYDNIWLLREPMTRKIEHGSRIHSSVIERMKNPKTSYSPKQLPSNPDEVKDYYQIVD